MYFYLVFATVAVYIYFRKRTIDKSTQTLNRGVRNKSIQTELWVGDCMEMSSSASGDIFTDYSFQDVFSVSDEIIE